MPGPKGGWQGGGGGLSDIAANMGTERAGKRGVGQAWAPTDLEATLAEAGGQTRT